MPDLTPEQVEALRLRATWDQVQSMIVTLAKSVVAADFYLHHCDSSPPSRIKAETRALVEEAMALLRPQP